MSETDKAIPELNEKRSTFPSLYGERQLSGDYSDTNLFTDENLESRGRYFSLLERDPETNERQRAELNIILTRIAFELSYRSGRLSPHLVPSDERA